VGQVARKYEMRNPYKIFIGKLKERDHSKNLGVDMKIMLGWILGK